MGRANNQLVTTRHSCEVKGCNTTTISGVEPNHSWWWPFKSPTNGKEARTSSACTAAIEVSKQSKIQSSRFGVAVKTTQRFCLTPQTLKTSISQQPHSNLGWRNAPYPSRTYAAIPRALGILPRHNKTGQPNPGTSNSDTWCISETKVSEHNSMSYWDDATVRSLRFPARPRTLLQSCLQTVGTARRGPGVVSTSRNWRLRQG